MKSIRTEIVIDAPPERVWAALTSFDGYREWNPCIRRIGGKAGPDETLRITIRFGWLPPIRFKARIERFSQNVTLGWRGVLFGGLLEGFHWFELHSLDSSQRTRFVHCETFNGVLSTPVFVMLAGLFRQSYDAMNRALKACVEQK